MKVLISGGSGLVGRAISKELIQRKHEVAILSRSRHSKNPQIKSYAWDPKNRSIDLEAFENTEVIINLAGANIAQRWTPQAKNEILRSRLDATRLLAEKLAEEQHQVHTFISASAVGYYPNSLTRLFTEEDAPGNNFLSTVCQKWEQEAMQVEKLGIRTIRMRIGIVLDADEGALAKMAQPIKFALGAPLGSGKQWMPWIHREDLARMFAFVLEQKQIQSDVFNAVGSGSATNAQLNQALAKALGKPTFLPPVPAPILKLLLGEMAETVLASNKVSAEKITNLGFSHRFKELEAALNALYPN